MHSWHAKNSLCKNQNIVVGEFLALCMKVWKTSQNTEMMNKRINDSELLIKTRS